MSHTSLVFNSPFFDTLNQKERDDNIAECLTCGICVSRCTWYDGEGGPNPRQMVRMAQLGLDDLLAQNPMIWDCMVCNHCTEACPMGITMGEVIRKARSLKMAEDLIPQDIRDGIKRRLETGDVNGFTKTDFIETIDWLNEEIKDENDDPKALIPYDQQGARYLYLPNPRELGMNVMHLTAMARLFYAFGEPWTMSSRHTDVTNWGYFIGDDDITRTMALQVVEAAEDLGIKTLVLSECGHAFVVLRKLLHELIGRKPGFNVMSIVELTLEMAEKGAIKLNRETHPYPIIYHDPCNLGRKSGVFEVPRRLLSMVCREVVELHPNRQNAVCCGGGGGLLQDSTSLKKRMISGKAKADQIRVAGAKHVATACLSCHRQLTELSKEYKLEVKVDTVAALAEEAL
ncbi:MAG: (Fe-S)-binding protein [Deltaproteobacteria bacterium]|nr:(Fe-S)-binding protein [Deltaproteobacteria bacterium]